MMYSRLPQHGFTLVETLVAISVLMLALVGPIVIAAKGLQTSYYAREQVTALYLAQEGVEAITELRNDAYIEAVRSGTFAASTRWGWDDELISACFDGSAGCNFAYRVNSGSYEISSVTSCSNESSCVLQQTNDQNGPLFTLGESGAADSRFTRVVTLDDSSIPDAVVVTSRVTWATPLFSAGQSVVLTSVLYDYLKDFEN